MYYIALVFFNRPKTKEIGSLLVQISRNSGTKTAFFIWKQNYYALKWFSEAVSAPIRSASKFCFDLDGRNFFQLLFCFFFRSIKIFPTKFFEVEKKESKKILVSKNPRFFLRKCNENFPNQNFEKIIFGKKIFFFKKSCFRSKISQKFFDRPKKYFLKKLRNFFEHQYRFKISLRIEWEHSQPLKITLKHSNFAPKGKPPVLVPLTRANCTNCPTISLDSGRLKKQCYI